MTIQPLDLSYNQSTYNALATHPLQSWEWGEARRAMGIEVLRFGEYKDTQLVNVYQITLHLLPKLPYRIGYLPRSTMPSDTLLEYLATYGKAHKIIFFKIEPNARNDQFSIINFHKTLRIGNCKLVLSRHPLFPDWTMTLDLTPTEDLLLQQMKSKTRYNIKLAQKKGVYVKEMSDAQGYAIFAKLYFETCKRQHYFGHTPQYHQIIWRHLKDKIAHILIAFYEQTPVAAYELFYFNEVLYYPYGGTALEYRNLMGANLLMWEAICFGKRVGAKSFDMWGSLPPTSDPTHPWAGFTRFKEGYAAQFTRMVGSYDLVINPIFYKLYNTAHVLRSRWMSM